MNPFDAGIIGALNGFARHSYAFDAVVTGLASDQLIKGGVIVILVWWAWFRREHKPQDREHLLFGLVACLAAVAVARGLAGLLPFRERPLRNPDLHFVLPYRMTADNLIHWSSFPSDHAALFMALSVSIGFVSRRAGLLAVGYCLLVICLPRVYLGIHYPTDILAGCLIGAGLASSAGFGALRKAVTRPAVAFLERRPGEFYALLFLLTFQIATVFDSVRYIAHGLLEVLRRRLP